MPRLSITVVVVIVLAGCSGDQQGDRLPDGFDEAGGTLDITVVDDNLLPVADATVLLDELGRQSNTSDAGVARFASVPPGQYRLVALRDGYEASETLADVLAGSVAKAKLVLVALPSTKAYFETKIVKIHIGCTFNINDGMVRGSLECADANHEVGANLSFEPNWTQYIAEASWPQGGLSTNPEFLMSLYYLTPVAGGVSSVHAYADVEGSSPIRVVLNASTNHTELGADIATPGPEGGPLNITMWKHATEIAGQRVIGVSFQQPMDLFFTTFFFAPHPDPATFTAIPDR